MNFYESELKRIRSTIFSNQEQIEKVVAIKHYIQSNYQSNLNLDHLSQNSFVSKYHLVRLFRKYYGLTPRQFLIDQRIKHAKKHLKQGMTVTETCFAVGFESLGSFSTLFKNKTGSSPQQFKKSNFGEAK